MLPAELLEICEGATHAIAMSPDSCQAKMGLEAAKLGAEMTGMGIKARHSSSTFGSGKGGLEAGDQATLGGDGDDG